MSVNEIPCGGASAGFPGNFEYVHWIVLRTHDQRRKHIRGDEEARRADDVEDEVREDRGGVHGLRLHDRAGNAPGYGGAGGVSAVIADYPVVLHKPAEDEC